MYFEFSSLFSQGSHILVPSKYAENLYQSLAGLNYTLDPNKKRLIRRTLSIPAELNKFNIKAQDTCFTQLGQSFQRFIIDGNLDDRFEKTMMRTNSILDPRVVVENSLKNTKE